MGPPSWAFYVVIHIIHKYKQETGIRAWLEPKACISATDTTCNMPWTMIKSQS
jgi:hypothetical protein